MWGYGVVLSFVWGSVLCCADEIWMVTRDNFVDLSDFLRCCDVLVVVGRCCPTKYTCNPLTTVYADYGKLMSVDWTT